MMLGCSQVEKGYSKRPNIPHRCNAVVANASPGITALGVGAENTFNCQIINQD